MSHARLSLAAACAAALLTAPALAEDLTLVFKSTGDGASGTSTQYFSADKMRTTDGEHDTVIEYAAGRIVSIDHKKKEYSETTLAEMEAAMKAAAAKMDEASAKMEQQMASLPPQMREKMEQMMGGVASSVTVTKGGTREVAGYPCQDYTMAMGQMMTTKLCATTALHYPAPNVDNRKFASLAEAGTAFANNPMFKGMGKMVDEMKKIEGITIAESTSVKIMGRSTDSAKEAVEIKQGPIPTSMFDLAALTKGYKKVANPIAKMSK